MRKGASMCMLKFLTVCFLLAGVSSYAQEIESKQVCSPTECYTILKKLGEGAFGEVFEVENSKGMKFALKTIKDTGMNHPFTNPTREFEVGQLLDHPNIIRSFDLFSFVNDKSEKTENLILQLVNGQILYSVGRGELSKSEAAHAAITLCNALQYAHSMGLIHIDLHFANLMLDEKLGIMIIDLASFIDPEKFSEMFLINESSSSTSSLLPLSSSESPFFKMRAPISSKFANSSQLFLLKPRLFEVIKNVQEKVKRQEKHARTMLFDVSTSDSSSSLKMTDVLIQQNFNDIVEMCNYIIKKSNLSWEEKKLLMKNIIEFSWDYEEDMAEGKVQAIGFYFDAIINYLEGVKL